MALRRTARPGREDALRELHGDKIEIAVIADVATGDYTEALKGVGAILHVAAPLGSKANAEQLLSGAIGGATNILKQAAAAGVHKVVITSSWATASNPDKPEVIFSDYVYTENDWFPGTREEALDGTHPMFWVYCAAKTLAEKEVWKFAAENPQMDITTINPPFIYGPYLPGTKVKESDLGSLRRFYLNVLPKEGGKLAPIQFDPPMTVDVRDVAKAHVLALESPPPSKVGQKRILVAGPNISYRDAVNHLSIARPNLKGRLPDASEAQWTTIATVDVSRARDVLGLTEYTDWKKTVEDTADSLLAAEKTW